MEDYRITWETLNITPENTSLEYLLRTDFVFELAELFKDGGKISDICATSHCSECKLSEDRYSQDIRECGEGCTECRNTIKWLANAVKVLKDTEIKPKQTNTCESCKYYNDGTDFKFCNAWHNFTTAEMYCGYYQKKAENSPEELDKTQDK